MNKNISRRNFIKTGTLAGLGIIVGFTAKNRFDIIIKNNIYTDVL